MMKTKLPIVLFLLLALSSWPALWAQSALPLPQAEARLTSLFDTLARGKNEHIRYHANEAFIDLLSQSLEQNKSFDYPFDLLPCVKLRSKDKQFRLFNWMVNKDNGGIEYFALLQSYSETLGKYVIIRLHDATETLFEWEQATFNKEQWLGAFYTEVIETEAQDRKYYTLLGWNGNDKTINRKIIEVVTFKSNGDPLFGAPVFRWKKEKIKRKIFEYSRKASMILRYDLQAYTEVEPPKKAGKKPKEKIIRSEMIVFDRLVPQQAELKDNPGFYIPGGGIYDALIWIDGRWTLKTDIIAKNPNEPKRRQTRNKELHLGL